MSKLAIVGLGNFGAQYRYNRHNLGVQFVDYLVQKQNLSWTHYQEYSLSTWSQNNHKTLFIQLHTFMNCSGVVLKKVLRDLQLKTPQLLICVDNLDLAFGKTKLMRYLPNNGHNGLANISQVCQTKQITSLHLGIGKQQPVHKWVLSNFSDREQSLLQSNFFPDWMNKLWETHTKWRESNDTFYQKWYHGASVRRNLAVIGGMWGDEGKGKIVDFLATQNYQTVARFSGGDNAGHTLKINDTFYHFSILPVSIIQSNIVSIIGRGCLLNLIKLVDEITLLQKIQPKINLKISPFSHLILPYHLLFDELEEKVRQNDKIGTTKRGIGPCLQDKVGRFGIQIKDLFHRETFQKKITTILRNKNLLLTKIYNHPPINAQDVIDNTLALFAKVKMYVDDVWTFCQDPKNHPILFEGAQGTLLDINFGTYPFVTSSSTTSWQIGNSFGKICGQTSFLGVFKVYCTRVGQGPLPTEMDNCSGVGAQIVVKGNEFGVVTKRRRRIGWFDAVVAKYSCSVNNFSQIALTLLDVLSGIEKLKICVAYRKKEKTSTNFNIFAEVNILECEYITLPGWKEDISAVQEYHKLPKQARDYVENIERIIQVPITMISVGPERNQVIWKKPLK